MSIQNCVGFSDFTKIKQIQFRGILRIHLEIVTAIYKKYEWAQPPYYFFDMNAGPGKYADFKGSPLIFLEEIKRVGLKYKAIFYENHQENYESLKALVNEPNVIILNQDHSEMRNLPPLKTDKNIVRFGMVYSDQSGSPPPWDVLQDFFAKKEHKRIDLVIYVSAANLKRVSMAYKTHPRLIDAISTINKKFWLVRDPQGRHQWTFLIGTNWVNFPEWWNQGFYSIKSAKGKAILERLNYTNEEIKSKTNLLQLRFENV